MSYSEKLLKHARYYAKMGLRVFPCKPRDKVPATAHGCKDATTDPAQIAAWWDGVHLYNVGIATGGGLVALDVDINHSAGKYGDETLAEVEQPTAELLKYDSESLGDAVKCYILNGDPGELNDAPLEAFSIVAKIRALEAEC